MTPVRSFLWTNAQSSEIASLPVWHELCKELVHDQQRVWNAIDVAAQDKIPEGTEQ